MEKMTRPSRHIRNVRTRRGRRMVLVNPSIKKRRRNYGSMPDIQTLVPSVGWGTDNDSGEYKIPTKIQVNQSFKQQSPDFDWQKKYRQIAKEKLRERQLFASKEGWETPEERSRRYLSKHFSTFRKKRKNYGLIY